MKLFALMSWFDENPAWLHAAIASLGDLGIHHLIAVDGAYALYPDGKPRSHIDQYGAIHEAAARLDIGLTIYTPATTWQGNEIEKRTFMFRLAEHHAEAGRDWYYIADADETIRETPDNLHDRLRTSVFDAAEATYHEQTETGLKNFAIPKFFRAIPGLHVTGNHFTYKTPDGRALWGNAITETLEPRDISGVSLYHHTIKRHADRRSAAKRYYDTRDAQLVEAWNCQFRLLDGSDCGVLTSKVLPRAWRWCEDGQEGAVADWLPVCEEHMPPVATIGRQQLASLIGYDDALAIYQKKKWVNAVGPAPGAAPQPVHA